MSFEIEQVGMKRPYFGERGSLPISLCVIHYTCGHEGGDLETLRGGTDRKVSVHYLVGRTEKFGVKALVPEDKAAWHAGQSRWTDHAGQQRNGVNSFSIGIEISNMGPPEPFNDFQYAAVAQLAREIMARHPLITLSRFVGHQDISPGRKVDPGPLFDWKRFRSMVTETAQPLKVVLLGGMSADRLIPCRPEVEKGVTRVDVRALCDALDIATVPPLSALAGCHPTIGNDGAARVDLRPFVEARGCDVLAHKLETQNKIYLRRRNPAFDEDEDGGQTQRATTVGAQTTR